MHWADNRGHMRALATVGTQNKATTLTAQGERQDPCLGSIASSVPPPTPNTQRASKPDGATLSGQHVPKHPGAKCHRLTWQGFHHYLLGRGCGLWGGPTLAPKQTHPRCKVSKGNQTNQDKCGVSLLEQFMVPLGQRSLVLLPVNPSRS